MSCTETSTLRGGTSYEPMSPEILWRFSGTSCTVNVRSTGCILTEPRGPTYGLISRYASSTFL